MRTEEEIKKQLKSEIALKDILLQQRQYAKVERCIGAILLLEWVLGKKNEIS